MSYPYEPTNPNTKVYLTARKIQEWSPLVTVIVSGIALFIIAAQAFIYWKQAKIMENTLAEVRNGSALTEKTAKAASDQANASSQQVTAMREQLEIMRDQSKTLNDSLAETRRSVEAAEKQAVSSQQSAKAAQQSAGITQQSFRLLERPALGAEGAVLTKLEAGQEIEGVVEFKNSGHTAAQRTTIRTHFVFQQATSDISAPCPDVGEPSALGIESRTIIPVGGAKRAHPHSFTKANDVDIKRIESGEWWAFVYAIIRYESLSGQKYFTEYYARYNPKRKDFEECGTHNSAN